MGSETFINWAKQLLERDRINVYILFSGRYPVGMPQYRSILLTESPDRVMSYDLLKEPLAEKSQASSIGASISGA